MSRRPAARLGAAAVALAAALAGCGLPDDREPRVIGPEDAPLDLEDTGDGASSATGGDEEVVLYFVREGLLLEVERRAPDTSLTTAVNLLLDGPTTAEADELLSLILDETALLDDATVDDNGVGILNLGCRNENDPSVSFPEGCGVLGVGGTDQVLVFGQLACTATAVQGVSGVLFQQEGEMIPPPLPDLGTTTEPVRCSDYRSLREPS